MKKFLALVMVCVGVFAFAACGSSESSQKQESESEAPKVERTVDAVAEYLGLTGGEETFYQMIGAQAGKEYNDGAVELYQFAVDSEDYKAIADGNGVLTAAACKAGIVLVFPNEEDSTIIEKFNSIEFKK